MDATPRSAQDCSVGCSGGGASDRAMGELDGAQQRLQQSRRWMIASPASQRLVGWLFGWSVQQWPWMDGWMDGWIERWTAAAAAGGQWITPACLHSHALPPTLCIVHRGWKRRVDGRRVNGRPIAADRATPRLASPRYATLPPPLPASVTRRPSIQHIASYCSTQQLRTRCHTSPSHCFGAVHALVRLSRCQSYPHSTSTSVLGSRN